MVEAVSMGASNRAGAASDSPRFGPTLALWAALVLGLNGVIWLAGFRTSALAEGVEQGAARVESRGIGEVSDDLIRRAIQTQHDTLSFWTTLAWLGDFLVEPLALAARALAAATLFASVAALVGRPVRYELALNECATAQGFWVLGLAVQAALMMTLRRGDIETSPTLLLPQGVYPAAAWLALRQLDLFAVLGWSALARGAWRRGQVNLTAAVLICVMLWLVEAVIRIGFGLVIGAGARLVIAPG
ncbi:hypothetical protein [Singulisphaera sp. GP187]|uniref:hypothetical protein n=1 Tax=Singulisphaera sp. GP187 TaxID=1882752 RepID=UPI0020B12BE7|nr:hypothetical protein [Singulisphaera sp. GP187]